MIITPIHTEKVTVGSSGLEELLDTALTDLPEGSILAVTSKVVSICEGRVVKSEEVSRDELIPQEADLFLPPSQSKYQVTLTIKDGILIPSAGIDESNSNGYHILWPSNPQQTANQIRAYLRKRFSRSRLGVLITDSKTTPLRWGTTGVGLAYSGFKPLRNYIGTPDLFGRPLQMTKANIFDALAAAAVVIMGEGSEQTPLALLEDLPFVEFTEADPTEEELASLQISLEEDLYAPILTAPVWEKGHKSDTLPS